VNLSGNRISSLSALENLGELEVLEIGGNPISCAELKKLERVLGPDITEEECQRGE
jgi:Leucine-rich repeat (LRR) protein